MSKQSTIRVQIGTIQSSNGGITLDTCRTVEFTGEQLASYSEPGKGRNGTPTDTRRRVETLYRVADGRLGVCLDGSVGMTR